MIKKTYLITALCLLSLTSCDHSGELKQDKIIRIGDAPLEYLHGCVRPYDLEGELKELDHISKTQKQSRLSLLVKVSPDIASKYAMTSESIERNISFGYVGLEDAIEEVTVSSNSVGELEGGSRQYLIDITVVHSSNYFEIIRARQRFFKYEIKLSNDLAMYNDVEYPKQCRDFIFREGFNLEVKYG